MNSQIAIVTGGGSGIGAAIAEELAGSGMRVMVVDCSVERLETVKERISASGGEVVSAVADVSDHHAMSSVARDVVERFGRIDILVANAGIHEQSKVVDGDPERWARVVETNVLGVAYAARAVLPTMYDQGTGHVIIVASVSGRVTYVGEPVYAASKHATVAFGDCLRQEATPHGVKVTIIEPGLVGTDMLNENPFAQELIKQVTPLQPVDCARAVRFALEAAPNCSVNEIVLRPKEQVL